MTSSYSFHSFYACYLLKSATSSRASRNYIGSAVNPAQRLRQHNGLIIGGARKTRKGQPWIMQLLIHGFPSRPAATSFEFAWQNPHKTRFLRDNAGKPLFEKRGIRLEQNILILQRMIRTHPFSTWPLHVKLFTEEAVQLWDALVANSPLVSTYQQHLLGHDLGSKNHASGNELSEEKERQKQLYHRLLFPPGFTCSVELEGVDGASGLKGSGRKGPVAVTDEKFTLPYLAKHTALTAAGRLLHCSICAAPIHDFFTNHLETTLCPHTGCRSVSHLACLAKSWLDTERDVVNASTTHFYQLPPTPISSPGASYSPSPSPSIRSAPACSHPLGDLPVSVCAGSSPLSISSSTSVPPSMSLPSTSHHCPTTSLLVLPSSVPTSNSGVTAITANKNERTYPNDNHSGPHSSPSPSLTPVSVPIAAMRSPTRKTNNDLHLVNSFNLGQGLVPRGGGCPSCGNYTLWGDLIRGCYRRHTGTVGVDNPDEGDDFLEEIEESDSNSNANSGSSVKKKVRAAKQAQGELPAKMKKKELELGMTSTVEKKAKPKTTTTGKAKAKKRTAATTVRKPKSAAVSATTSTPREGSGRSKKTTSTKEGELGPEVKLKPVVKKRVRSRKETSITTVSTPARGTRRRKKTNEGEPNPTLVVNKRSPRTRSASASAPSPKSGRGRGQSEEVPLEEKSKSELGGVGKCSQPENTTSTTEPTPSRRRGRPKKSEGELDSSLGIKKPKARTLGASTPSTKGGRGRPRKKIQEREPEPEVVKNLGRPRKATSTAASTPSRRPGRPKKSEGDLDSSLEVKTSKTRSPSASTPSTKGGRGRPRKEMQEQEPEPGIVKKRGRPRKATCTTASMPRRRPGRPRKSEGNQNSSLEVKKLKTRPPSASTPSTKGGRGRPRKEIQKGDPEPEVVKTRGRPRKASSTAVSMPSQRPGQPKKTATEGEQESTLVRKRGRPRKRAEAE